MNFTFKAFAVFVSLLTLTATTSIAQSTFKLKLSSQDVLLTPNVALSPNSDNEIQFSNEEVASGHAYRIVHFESLVGMDKNVLASVGIELFDYLPKDCFYAKLSLPLLSFPRDYSIDGIYEIASGYKISKGLLMEEYPDHALVDNDIQLEVFLFENEKINFEKHLYSIGGKIINEYTDYTIVQLPIHKISSLSEASIVKYITVIEGKSGPHNLEGRTSHGSSFLHGDNGTGLQFDGYGITVMMIDDGEIGPHIDLQNRYDQSACNLCAPASDLSMDHGDHVAGTIMGAGNLNPKARGMATGINFIVEDAWTNQPFDTKVPLFYATDSLVITSRSFGSISCTGTSYTSSSRQQDDQIRIYPSLMHVTSAGNKGVEDCGYGVVGWGNLGDGPQGAKNVLVVGAVDRYDNIGDFSSRGPLSDGRIKPDICGVGVDVFSTLPNNTYDSWQGTSMSTPGVSGTMAQLYQAYKEINGGAYPKSGLMKGIVMNTAVDLGNKGPDFIHGYGKINARRAYSVLENQTYFTDSVSTGDNQSHFINVPAGIKEVRIMTYWSDYQASVSASLDLVNDINMVVTDPGAVTYEPWVLDPTPIIANLNSPAVRAVDDLNNQEQVTIEDPIAGVYEINIDGLTIPQGPQEYYVIYEFVYDEITVSYPNGGEGFSPSSPQIVRWDAAYGTTDFTIEYTLDDGATWNPAGTATADKRYYTWSVASTVTGLARVRVTRGAISDVSDTTFAIIAPPNGLVIDWSCPDSLQFSWNAVAGAAGYEVSMLGNEFMDSIGTTTTNSMVVQVPAVNEVWLSVRSLITNNVKSERATAIGKQPGEFNCMWSDPYAEFSQSCTEAGTNYCFDLTDLSTNVDGSTVYSWYFPGGTPATSSDPNPTVCYPTAGDYDIAMVVDNGTGTDSIYLTNAFHIIGSPGLPYFEGFEYYPDFIGLDEWSVNNPSSNGTWEISSTVSLSGAKSAKMNNYGQPAGFSDDLTSGPIDLSTLSASDNITLSFRYAYKKRFTSNDEWLKVFVNNACEDNWVQRKTIHGSMLSPLVYGAPYNPQDETEWTTVHMTNVTSSYFTSNFRMRFTFEGDAGNNFYLDNINLYEGAPSDEIIMGLDDISIENVQIYPNPTDGGLNIQFGQLDLGNIDFEIKDLTGKTVFTRNILGQPGNNLVVIDTDTFASGVYLLQLTQNGHNLVRRFIVE